VRSWSGVVEMPAPDKPNGRPIPETAVQNPQEHRNTIHDGPGPGPAARGWPVFPLRPLDKRPLVKWKDQATTGPDQIRAWWEKWPDANIGIPTGAVSGLVVLDPDDDGPAGITALDQLQAELGELPQTLTVRTPGDSAKGKRPGLHLYLAHPGGKVKNSAGQLGDDLDVRGDGGYVAAAGSVLADGTYTVETDAPVAELPDTWAERLTGTRKERPALAAMPDPAPAETPAPAQELAQELGIDLAPKPGATGFTMREAVDIYKREVNKLKEAKEGTRNHQLNATAYAAGRVVKAGLFTRDKLLTRLVEMGEWIGLDEDEAQATAKSGLDVGIADANIIPDPVQEKATAAAKRTQAILDAALDATDLDSLPEPVPLLPGYLNREEYALLAGKFGTYKSFMALGWAYAVATGQGWAGSGLAEAVPVVYVAAEGITGFRGRLRALERRHGVKVPQGMLTVIRRPVHLANDDEVAGLRQIIERTGAQLVILDTWHRMTPGVEENSATETGGPLDRLLGLRDDYGATVLLVHHTGHAQRHARGSSALEDDADSSWMIRLGDGTEDDESRSAATPRTLIHRKSKDGELAEGRQLRLQVDEAGAATVDLDPFVLAPPTREPGKRGRPAKVDPAEATEALIRDLDQAGVPRDQGERPVHAWIALHRPGQTIPRAVVRSALALRRQRHEQATEALAQVRAGTGDPFHPGLEHLDDDQAQELAQLRARTQEASS
jgi:Bifunctional DNA primase/polymerase, N-terminal/AAA domain